jgi:hypothetical protein
MKSTTYEEKYKEMGLNTLEERRKILDLSQVSKIVKGIDKVNSDKIFTRMRDQRTR